MVDEKILNCIRESEIDTIEIALKKRKEDLISEGDVEAADLIDMTLKSLDNLNVCDEPRMTWLKGLAGIEEENEEMYFIGVA